MKFPKSVNVLLLGSGGRENAFAWKIAQSKRVAKLFIAPGNAGTKSCGINVDMNPTDFAIVKQFVISNNINLVVVGPEDPLVKGIYDYFVSDNDIKNIPVIGPSALGAKLEGSKDFAKNFMIKHGIPTAQYKTFTKGNIEEGYDFIETITAPYVLKADGLAAGKGVTILENKEEAKKELSDMLTGKFGAASSKVVIEEYLSGIEVSVFVATDGKTYKILPEAKDYKRIGEGDTGLNTGGMGAVSPVPFCDEAFMEKVRTQIVEPTVEGLKADEIIYNGFIFIGLMNCGGDPKVIEYNVRMGDPETEVVLPRIESDIVDLFEGIAFGSLKSRKLDITEETAATVVCVSEGYPGDYEKGLVIEGLETETESLVFHAGTTVKGKDVVTAGGRVLAVTSYGKSIVEAVNNSYKTIDKIHYKGKYFRKDIGKDLMPE
ncbi:MAG: phosphoribosylamine--glycine ligase [Rikenellaceae bacterium]|nr:phosphoribosylamine--glycine ligase [Rikenellaceae bacterium]